MRTPLIAGNWKMHKALAEARELVTGIREGIGGVSGVEVLVCPPYQHLFPLAEVIKGSAIRLGAQNAHFEPQGAFTGEVSVAMLVDAGCTHVILGHSERRQYFGEDGPLLAKKVRAAVAGGLTAVYCVGETLEERESGRTGAVVERHVKEVIAADVPADRLVIAYEPVWAIGTGKTATPEQAQEVHALIRGLLASAYDQATADSVRILYGGSVKPGNAEALLAQPDLDGALVGGACLAAADFVAIIRAAEAAVATPS
jgi:triosephosphate isomerase